MRYSQTVERDTRFRPGKIAYFCKIAACRRGTLFRVGNPSMWAREPQSGSCPFICSNVQVLYFAGMII
jgi:hypothetical protein